MLIPSVTEKSVIFIKELSFPQTAPTDDAFFNRNWAGACEGVVWAEVGSLQRRFEIGFEGGTPLQKTRKKGGR